MVSSHWLCVLHTGVCVGATLLRPRLGAAVRLLWLRICLQGGSGTSAPQDPAAAGSGLQDPGFRQPGGLWPRRREAPPASSACGTPQ
eukprot:5850104-Lingulodinium_polyedra.AAC.1